jgi:excinuclease ABC subunit B
MFNGDQARKRTLVEHGFRLPSCLDNRPLKFEEFEQRWNNVVFVSATPGPYELKKCGGEVVEQVIRPTGLVDPIIEVKPARGQVPDLLHQIQQRAAVGERTLVTALTKRLAEDLSDYIAQSGMKCKYLHSEIDTVERVELLRELREGKHDALVGVNLLREGLDLPEVSLVAILDADKEGFLRSETSLLQTIGRCARNINSLVILYADKMTPSMQRAIEETDRRRARQLEYNKAHNITPATIRKAIRVGLESEISAQRTVREAARMSEEQLSTTERITILEKEMLAAADGLEFERAAELRDRINALRDLPGMTPIPGDTGPNAEDEGDTRDSRPAWTPQGLISSRRAKRREQ